MEWFEYLIAIAAILFVGVVAFFGIRNKIKGKSSCTECKGNCQKCSGCSTCKNLVSEYKKAKEN
jgi:type IV secretory pathway TrbL component